MGIGAAFATGLVKGFTKNIEKQEASQLAEQAKIDGFETAAFTASLDPKKDTSGAFALIKSARQQLKERKPIDMFGRKTDGIDIDFAKLQGTMNSIGDYESVIGSGDFKFGMGVDVRKFGASGDSYAAITELNSRLLGSKKSMMKLASAPDSVLFEIEGLYKGHGGLIFNDFNVKQAQGANVALDTSIFSGMKNFNEIMKVRTNNPDYNVLDIIATGEKGQPTLVDDVDPSQMITMGNTDEYGPGYTTMGKALGASSDNLPAAWAGYTNLTAGIPLNTRQTWFNAARDIAQEYADTGMKLPNTPMSISTMDTTTARQLLKAVTEKIANDDGKSSAIGVAYVLGAFQQLPNWNPADGIKRVDKNITNKLVASQELFGQSAKESDFNKLVTFNNEIVDVLGVEGGETGLYGLLSMVETDFAGPAAVDNIKGKLASVGAIFSAFVGGDTAQLNRTNVSTLIPQSNIVSNAEGARLVNANEVDENGDKVKFVTEGFIQDLNGSVEAARQRGRSNAREGESIEEAGARYARFEAIRISLAFQMARAADPSGRLSNQDIEAQLQRLGKNTDTIAAMKARIQESIRDFETKQARYGAIIELVGDAGGKASAGSKKLIKGIIAVDRLSKRAGFTSFSQFEGQITPATTTYSPPNPVNVSTQFVSESGGQAFIATDDTGAAIPNPDGKGGAVYIDVDGNVINVVPKGQSVTAAPAAPADVTSGAAAPVVANEAPAPAVTSKAAPAPVVTGEDADSPTADKGKLPETQQAEGIDPKLVTMVQGGNNRVGWELIEKSTGNKLPGKYTAVNGRFVPLKVGL